MVLPHSLTDGQKAALEVVPDEIPTIRAPDKVPALDIFRVYELLEALLETAVPVVLHGVIGPNGGVNVSKNKD